MTKKRRNPVAKAVKLLKPKVVPNKKPKEKDKELIKQSKQLEYQFYE